MFWHIEQFSFAGFILERGEHAVLPLCGKYGEREVQTKLPFFFFDILVVKESFGKCGGNEKKELVCIEIPRLFRVVPYRLDLNKLLFLRVDLCVT